MTSFLVNLWVPHNGKFSYTPGETGDIEHLAAKPVEVFKTFSSVKVEDLNGVKSLYGGGCR